jgi:hypothetical protein
MSLRLEFRPPRNRDARLAGIGTNWSLPTITPPTDPADCKSWNDSPAYWESTTHPGQSPPTRFRDSLIASATLWNYQ